MAKTIEELELEAESQAALVQNGVDLSDVDVEFDADEDEDEDEEQNQINLIYNDLLAAWEMVRRAGLMLEYMSDPSMCKVISKRERELMGKLASSLAKELEEVKATYKDAE